MTKWSGDGLHVMCDLTNRVGEKLTVIRNPGKVGITRLYHVRGRLPGRVQ
jgi:hypothetical protein